MNVKKLFFSFLLFSLAATNFMFANEAELSEGTDASPTCEVVGNNFVCSDGAVFPIGQLQITDTSERLDPTTTTIDDTTDTATIPVSLDIESISNVSLVPELDLDFGNRNSGKIATLTINSNSINGFDLKVFAVSSFESETETPLDFTSFSGHDVPYKITCSSSTDLSPNTYIDNLVDIDYQHCFESTNIERTTEQLVVESTLTITDINKKLFDNQGYGTETITFLLVEL